jgi:phospholipid/cholesterol/gamma-HCH transport system substrate-binding protein
VQKQAPTVGKLATMALFALSCFGLLLFLWLAFGGPIPLKPTGYQFRVAFDEAVLLAPQSDVRVAGVQVGRVVDVSPATNATIATLEIDRKFAPLKRDTRATLRDKTLLGQTYVELTLGGRASTTVPERGLLDVRNVKETRQLDELLNTFDPYTRRAFRTWQQGVAKAVDQRGADLNDTIGNLPEFARSGGDLFEVLDMQKQALGALVRNGGIVFEALTEREDQLANMITNGETVFRAIQAQREDFAELWNILPTFQAESRATFRRLERFANDTRPLVQELEPAMRDLRPTLVALRDLSPDLRRLFQNLDPLIDVSLVSLPAQREIFEGLRPVLRELGPWLGEVNPTLDWIGQHSHTLTDLFANLGVATNATTGSRDPQATGHYLRQFGPSGAETLAVHPNRLSTNRGNTYINPLELVGPAQSARGIIPSFDCRNVSGDQDKPSNEDSPPCFNQAPYLFQRTLEKYPRVKRESYAQGTPATGSAGR